MVAGLNTDIAKVDNMDNEGSNDNEGSTGNESDTDDKNIPGFIGKEMMGSELNGGKRRRSKSRKLKKSKKSKSRKLKKSKKSKSKKSHKKGPSKWIAHVKAFCKRTGKNFPQALKDPMCRKTFKH